MTTLRITQLRDSPERPPRCCIPHLAQPCCSLPGKLSSKLHSRAPYPIDTKPIDTLCLYLPPELLNLPQVPLPALTGSHPAACPCCLVPKAIRAVPKGCTPEMLVEELQISAYRMKLMACKARHPPVPDHLCADSSPHPCKCWIAPWALAL